MVEFINRRFHGTDPELVFEKLGTSAWDHRAYKVAQGEDIEFEIDIDHDGKREKVTITDKFKIEYHLSDAAQLFASSGKSKDYGGSSVPPMLEYSVAVLDAVERVFVGDFDRDGDEDYMLYGKSGGEKSTVVYFNQTPAWSLGKSLEVQIKKREINGIPDYDRSGTIHISQSYDKQGVISSSTISRDEVRQTITCSNLNGNLPDDAFDRLPQRVVVEQIGSDDLSRATFGKKLEAMGHNALTIKDRFERSGFDVADDLSSFWPQDMEEKVVAGGAVESVDARGDGGNIQYLRNDRGDLFVTVTDRMIRDVQRFSLQYQDGGIMSYQDGMASIGAKFGVDAGHVLVLPSIRDFVHLDQQMVGIDDGKVIVIELPKEHPDYKNWQMALDLLRGNGFSVVGEVQLSEYYLKNSRSPLNMLIHRTSEGKRVYMIPVDPSALYNPENNEFIELGKNGYQDEEAVVGGRFSPLEIFVFYDPANIPEHSRQVRDALIGAGVSEDSIKYFYYNGVGDGSLHCRTNQDPI